jgi:uncharacterized Zn finger protein
MIQLRVNGSLVGDPELALRIFSLRKRVDRAAGLVDSVKPLERGMYAVKSSRTDEVYVMDLRGQTCTCMDWTVRGGSCKHQIAAKLACDRLERSNPKYEDLY